MSNKQSQKRNPAAGLDTDLPPVGALPAEPLAAAPDAAADTPPVTKRSRAKPTAAPTPGSAQTAELTAPPAADTVPPAAKRSRAKRTAANLAAAPQPEQEALADTHP